MFEKELSQFKSMNLEQKIEELLHVLSFFLWSHDVFSQIQETIEKKLYTPEYIDQVYEKILLYTEKVMHKKVDTIQNKQQQLYEILQHIKEMENNDPDKKNADLWLEQALSTSLA